MAASNGNSTSKLEVYESLYLICNATQQITDHLDRLRSADILKPMFVELHKTAAQQLRAEITASSTLNLTAPEADEAYRYESKRIRMETKLAQMKKK